MAYTQITGFQIQDQSISQNNIAVATITADVIQSNSITDEKIQSIAASKVEILDTANKITATDAETAFAEIFTKQEADKDAIESELALKAVKLDVDAALALKADLAGSNSQNFATKDLVVSGNLVVSGTNTTVESTTVTTTDNLIEINKGEVGAGVTKGSAGLKVDRGTSAAYYILFDEAEDMFKVGVEGNLETIASHNWVNTQISNNQKSLFGSSAFAGFSSSVTVDLPAAITTTNYVVTVTPTANANGALGEVYVEKNVGSFVVYNSGAATVAFDYIVMY